MHPGEYGVVAHIVHGIRCRDGGRGGLGLVLHYSEVEVVVDVLGEGADEGGEVPGVGLGGGVAEGGHVEEAGAVAGGGEELVAVAMVGVVDEAVDEEEGLERHRPVPGLAEAVADLGDAGGDEGAGEGNEADDLPHVPLVRGPLVVAGGLDDGDLQVRHAVAAGDQRHSDARLVLHQPDGLSHLAWPHRRSIREN
ncbi:uncharacterized protein LOC127252343 [Andrographis paniculata]|uniref:uncharacterized protein LOC127252343 n=1 Tax=Andrographis paniculata TaxID=175694 RepID=UPI0021E70821|nr:uncharacterized protein LOC127252343 [Andrographis paniculata]XP_051132441.1 uncharacterized protein LOC127252343 [Andrographis paniculata]